MTHIALLQIASLHITTLHIVNSTEKEVCGNTHIHTHLLLALLVSFITVSRDCQKRVYLCGCWDLCVYLLVWVGLCVCEQ